MRRIGRAARLIADCWSALKCVGPVLFIGLALLLSDEADQDDGYL